MTDAAPDVGRYDTVTLLSDLGNVDGFVGVVHSVIRQMAPGAGIVDLTHDIAPFDVRGGSLTLARSVQYLCPGVIIAAVDPATGSGQRAIAIEVANGAAVLIGPDNGLLAPGAGMLGGAERAVVLDDPAFHLPTAASTFAARDVYAPVAAHLCSGVPFEDLGTGIDPSSLMPGLVPLTSIEPNASGVPVLHGEVLWVDRFGNAQLNVQPDELDEWGDRLELRVGATPRTVARVSSFAALSVGELGLLLDADGLISVVADQSSAAADLGIGVGDAVTLGPLDDGDTADGVRTAVTIGRTRPVPDPGRDA